MDILIIGGTQFLGRALVEAGRRRGHRLTLFNRGRTNPGLYSEIETLIGDRETQLERLAGRRWDAVIDTCGYVPRVVALSAQALKDRVSHYTFISTLSVYPIQGAPQRDERAAVLPLVDEAVEDVTGETYGPLKVGCEKAVEAAFPGRALLIRAGLIVGPWDPTNRFTYWVTRTARGGAAIAPPAQQPIQFIDVRDLAEFTLRQTEARAAECYNVSGPAARLNFGDLLAGVKAALGSDVHYHHLSDAFLREHQVGEFMELPLWVNAAAAEGFMRFSIGRALRAGLRFRPLAETVRAIDEWARTLPLDAAKPADLPREKEAALLAKLE